MNVKQNKNGGGEDKSGHPHDIDVIFCDVLVGPYKSIIEAEVETFF